MALPVADGALLEHIRTAGDELAVCRLAKSLPALLASRVTAGIDAPSIAAELSRAGAAIAVRLIELAEAHLGEPPVAYSFVVAGSLARGEQIAGSDQDNALVLADDYREDRHGAYFSQLGNRVCRQLDACGYRLCPGGIMASNARWRLPLLDWQRAFRRWIDEPDPKALLRLGIFFDLDHLYGEAALVEQLRRDFLDRASSNPLFLAHLAASARGFRPAISWLGRLKFKANEQGQATMNIKRHGITPIVNLARVLALAANLPALNTHERLAAAAKEGRADPAAVADLLDAYDELNRLRLAHQARRIANGDAADYDLRRHELSPTDEQTLKRAFRSVLSVQAALARRFQTGAFG